MTQFMRVHCPPNGGADESVVNALQKLEGVLCVAAEGDWFWVVSRDDPGSAGPLVDDLFNRVWNKEDAEDAPLLRVLHEVARCRARAELWYSNDSADLPTFASLEDACAELLRQASVQPPEIYLAFRPTS